MKPIANTTPNDNGQGESETYNEKLARVRQIHKLLKQQYPKARIALRYTSPWELLVAVILSAQCTDIMVNKVNEYLFRKYKTLADYANADITLLQEDIKPTGFYRSKAKNIRLSASRIIKNYGSSVPQTMAELLTLPGVARKTANVVLGNAFGVVEGIAVDTHVLRLSQRLRFVDLATIGGKHSMTFTKKQLAVVDYKKDADPQKIERQLMAIFPKKEWFQLTYLLIDHGRAVCKAQNPRCHECVLAAVCPASRT